MEDAKYEASQVQRNRSQAFLTEINGNIKNKFDKTSIFTIGGNSSSELVSSSESGESDDGEGDSDVISDLIGHIGPWQLFWALIMCLYQFPTTFHIFCLVFQVSRDRAKCSSKKVKLTALSCSRIRIQLLLLQFQFVGSRQKHSTSGNDTH